MSDTVSRVLPSKPFTTPMPAVTPPCMSAADVVRILRRACEDLGGQKRWAEAAELSPQYVNDVLAGRKAPGELMCLALGLERVVTYRRRGS